MRYDDLALKYLYGADKSYHGGDTVYKFNPYNGLVNVFEGKIKIDTLGDENPYNLPMKIFRHLIDNKGIDTIDASAIANQNMTIDLRPGQWSTVDASKKAALPNIHAGNSISDVPGNFSIPYLFQNDQDFYFENAITGNGNDRIIGNASNNFVDGGDGIDTFCTANQVNYVIKGNNESYFLMENMANMDKVDMIKNVEKVVMSNPYNQPYECTIDQLNPQQASPFQLAMLEQKFQSALESNDFIA